MTAPLPGIRQVVLEVLAELAPEADLSALDPRADFREALDLDSFDFLRFIQRLSVRLGRDVPDALARTLTTLHACDTQLGEESALS
jgi:acyl carrier protein